MKVIFLDVDGVLNSTAWYEKRKEAVKTQKNTTHEDWRKTHIDPEAVKLVKEIVDKTGAKIVLSSSWRGVLDVSRQFFKSFGLDIMDETTRNIQVFYEEHPLHTFRGLEIDYYLQKNKDITEYVILDDDSDMLFKQKDHFVQTSTHIGICQADVDKAISILNTIKK